MCEPCDERANWLAMKFGTSPELWHVIAWAGIVLGAGVVTYLVLSLGTR